MNLNPLPVRLDTRESFIMDVIQQGYRPPHARHLASILYPPPERVRHATSTRRATQRSPKTPKNGRVKT